MQTADFPTMSLERLESIVAGTDAGLRSHCARILADREINLRGNMAGRCATCRKVRCSCPSEAWLGKAA